MGNFLLLFFLSGWYSISPGNLVLVVICRDFVESSFFLFLVPGLRPRFSPNLFMCLHMLRISDRALSWFSDELNRMYQGRRTSFRGEWADFFFTGRSHDSRASRSSARCVAVFLIQTPPKNLHFFFFFSLFFFCLFYLPFFPF